MTKRWALEISSGWPTRAHLVVGEEGSLRYGHWLTACGERLSKVWHGCWEMRDNSLPLRTPYVHCGIGEPMTGLTDEDRAAIQRAIDTLNRVHNADPTVLPLLAAYRVPCNDAVADDPSVQVSPIPGSDGQCEVGLLGIINGLFGVDAANVGYIAAWYDGGVLSHFGWTVAANAATESSSPEEGHEDPSSSPT